MQISNGGKSKQKQQIHNLLKKEMLKNAKIIEIGPSLDMPPAGQSFTT